MTKQAPNQPAGNSQNGTLPLWVSAPSATNPNYTRNGTTQFYYTWDASGKITGIGSNSSGAPIANCVPK